MSYLDDIAAYAAANGFGIFDLSDDYVQPTIFVNPEDDFPMVPDQMISFTDRAGTLDWTFTQYTVRPSVTAVIRGLVNDYDSAHDQAWALFNLLAPIANQVIGGTSIQTINPTSTPTYLTLDSQSRTQYTVDFQVWINND